MNNNRAVSDSPSPSRELGLRCASASLGWFQPREETGPLFLKRGLFPMRGRLEQAARSSINIRRNRGNRGVAAAGRMGGHTDAMETSNRDTISQLQCRDDTEIIVEFA